MGEEQQSMITNPTSSSAPPPDGSLATNATSAVQNGRSNTNVAAAAATSIDSTAKNTSQQSSQSNASTTPNNADAVTNTPTPTITSNNSGGGGPYDSYKVWFRTNDEKDDDNDDVVDGGKKQEPCEEVQLWVTAGAGPLSVVLNAYLVVQNVNKESPIFDRIQIGDILAQIDDRWLLDNKTSLDDTVDYFTKTAHQPKRVLEVKRWDKHQNKVTTHHVIAPAGTLKLSLKVDFVVDEIKPGSSMIDKLQRGDKISRVDGYSFGSLECFVEYLGKHAHRKRTLEIRRRLPKIPIKEENLEEEYHEQTAPEVVAVGQHDDTTTGACSSSSSSSAVKTLTMNIKDNISIVPPPTKKQKMTTKSETSPSTTSKNQEVPLKKPKYMHTSPDKDYTEFFNLVVPRTKGGLGIEMTDDLVVCRIRSTYALALASSSSPPTTTTTSKSGTNSEITQSKIKIGDKLIKVDGIHVGRSIVWSLSMIMKLLKENKSRKRTLRFARNPNFVLPPSSSTKGAENMDDKFSTTASNETRETANNIETSKAPVTSRPDSAQQQQHSDSTDPNGTASTTTKSTTCELTFHAPAGGSLGIQLTDTLQVCKVKDLSPLLGQVLVGDELIKVNGFDVVGWKSGDVGTYCADLGKTANERVLTFRRKN